MILQISILKKKKSKEQRRGGLNNFFYKIGLSSSIEEGKQKVIYILEI